MKNYFLISISLVLMFAANTSCRKDIISTDPNDKLSFSKEKILFDTVFTSIGSSTHNFKILNRNSSSLKISKIYLKHGNSTRFRINVNGTPSNNIKDMVIAGNDSMYVFVEVTINPNDNNTPFIVTDSIIFEVNGNTQSVVLEAWGQNANYIGNVWLSGTLNTNKPYVFVGFVGVPTDQTLNIPAGTKIYFHREGLLAVYGSLKVNEEDKCDSTVFSSDRIEIDYKNNPGHWGEIYLAASSHDNIIRRAVIQNSNVGVWVDSFTSSDSSKPKLIMEKSIIRNMSQAGIYCSKTKIKCTNVLIYNCSLYGALIVEGGYYSFNHCTFENSMGNVRQTAIVTVNNSGYNSDKNPKLFFSLTNSIIWGTEEDELKFDFSNLNSTQPLYYVSNNILKLKKINFNAKNKQNTDPLFKYIDFNTKNYHLTTNSPAVNYSSNTNLKDDLDCKLRTDAQSDAGCYEFF